MTMHPARRLALIPSPGIIKKTKKSDEKTNPNRISIKLNGKIMAVFFHPPKYIFFVTTVSFLKKKNCPTQTCQILFERVY